MKRAGEKRLVASVIVPVRNAGADLPQLIERLERQTIPRTRYEVLIADDGSTDGSTKALSKEGVTVLSGPARNAYAARNRALAHARGDAMAFCDADCRPERDWLEEGLRALIRADLAAGRIRFTTPPRRSVWTIVDIDTTKDHELLVKLGNAETANLFVRAAVFEELGLFDDRQPGYGDFEFAQRCVSSAKRLVYAPRAIVAHPTRDSGASYVRNYWLMHRSYAEFEARAGRLPDGLKLRSWVPVVQTIRARRRVGRSLRPDRSLLAANGVRPTLREDLLALPLMYVVLPYVGGAGQLAGWLSTRRSSRRGKTAAEPCGSGHGQTNPNGDVNVTERVREHGLPGDDAAVRAPLSYAIVTPVRDEAVNLRRLAACVASQTRIPDTWLVVDDGSQDETPEVVRSLIDLHPWIRLAAAAGEVLARGAPIVRAIHAGLTELEPLPDVVVKLDADMSMPPDHFERLLTEFELDPRLGIAGGIGYEEQADGIWRQRHGTGPAVWGGCRAYRRECLREILPLEEHMGWDTIDLMKANIRGWTTEVFYDLAFRHHRVEGERDGNRLRTATIQGEAAHYMGYRFSYLVARTLYRSFRDPAAFGLLVGYARARAAGRPRCDDTELVAHVRSQQRLRKLPLRAREALRPRAALVDRST